MYRYTLDLLGRLESEIPPPPNCHHVICRAEWGSHDTNWEERFALQINDGGNFFCYFIDEADLLKNASDLADEIVAIHRKENPKAQLAVAAGQFIGTDSTGPA